MTEAGGAPLQGLRRFWGVEREEGATWRNGRVSVEAGRAVRGRLVSVELGEELRPPWLRANQEVRYWSERELRTSPAEGRVLAWVAEAGRRVPLVVEREKGEIELRFDPEEAIAAILEERYLQPRRPLHTLLPVPYHWVPGRIRLGLFRLMTARRPAGEVEEGFPAWPIEPSVEVMRWLYLAAWRRAAGRARGPAPSLWPEGRRYAFALSHDVDTAKGQACMPEIAALEREHGFTSTWFVVGRGYALDHDGLDGLRRAGHEIGLHGDRHDNRIGYLPEGRIVKRLDACQEVVARQRMSGFRAPSLLSSGRLRAVLARSFRYVSDTPDSEVSALVAPRRGCASVFPFEREGLLEIPITLPMEDKLLLAGLDEAAILEVWRRKLAWIRELGGLAQLVTHAEPHLVPRYLGAYREILKEVAADAAAWRVNLGGIAEWWSKERSA